MIQEFFQLQALKETIGNHALKDGTETRQLHEQKAGKKG